ncbi:MAG: DUF2889 domain-containing protein [Nocardioides sp.]|uniref:DUF2889 domain-containing protein n=1 Tax=Nocardioides sp. TaxID=35761 RepID=UPI0039E40A93
MSERKVTRTKTTDVIPLDDGRFRFEARLTDMSYGGNPGNDSDPSPIHDLQLTATVGGPDLTIEEIEVRPQTLPYRTCPFVLPLVGDLVGRSLTRGWRKAVLELSGGTRGCTHINTLLLGLSEMQAMVIFLRMNEHVAHAPSTREDGSWIAVGLTLAPRLSDACFSLREDGPVVQRGRAAVARSTNCDDVAD